MSHITFFNDTKQHDGLSRASALCKSIVFTYLEMYKSVTEKELFETFDSIKKENVFFKIFLMIKQLYRRMIKTTRKTKFRLLNTCHCGYVNIKQKPVIEMLYLHMRKYIKSLY